MAVIQGNIVVGATPNSSPAYFPAFPPTWVIPTGMPPIGQGDFELATPVVPLQVLPTVRIPPFTVGPSPEPPQPPTNLGTFANWAAVEAYIDANGINQNDYLTVTTGNGLPAGTWIYTGDDIAPGGSYTLNPGDWDEMPGPPPPLSAEFCPPLPGQRAAAPAAAKPKPGRKQRRHK